jgi:hypothetical protein
MTSVYLSSFSSGLDFCVDIRGTFVAHGIPALHALHEPVYVNHFHHDLPSFISGSGCRRRSW